MTTANSRTEISCQEFVELVTDLLEDQLDEARRVEMEMHAGECPGCGPYLDQIRQTIAGLRMLAEVDAGDFPRARAAALETFRELRGGANEGGADPG